MYPSPLLLSAGIPPAPSTTVGVVELIMVSLVVVAILMVLARKWQIPYPVLLVIGGLGLSFAPGLPKLNLDPELIFVFFLPPLLYPAALFTSWRDFSAELRPILLLAIGLVFFTILVTALFAHAFIGMALGSAFVLGAIISPSDAVAATAISHRLRVPRRIVTILEGESLVNDTSAFVAYRFGVVAVVTGSFSLADASFKFVLVGLGGIVVGLAFGFIATSIHRRMDDPPVQITLSLLTPFATYLAAEALGTSGVLAVVVCGLYNGWRSPEVINSRTRLKAGPVWEQVGFILNGLIFILIGLQLPEVVQSLDGNSLAGHSLGQAIVYALLIIVLVIVIRLVWTVVVTYVPRALSRKIRRDYPAPPWQEVVLIGWTGMRGADSLAAALALPLATANGTAFPDRGLIFFLTFSVIFGTLVLQGLSMQPVIRWLNLEEDHSAEKEERHARLTANRAALSRICELHQVRPVKPNTLQRLKLEYEDRIRQLESETAANGATGVSLYSSEYEELSQQALDAEREMIIKLRNNRAINDEVLRRIQLDIDLAEARLGHDETDETS